METLTKRVASVLKTTAFVALATLILVPASADADWKTKWSNGHKIESEDGNFKLKFGGRTQADWSFASADSDLEDAVGPVTDGNEFRRARIFFSGTIYKNIEYKVNYEFSDGGATEIKDLWIKFKPWGIKAGHFHEPFSLEQLTSSKYITFLERSLPDTFAPGRNTGIAYSNSSDSYTFGLGVFRDTDDFGVGTAEDRINITGRFVWRPMYDKDRMLHLGFGFTDKSAEDGDTVRFRQRPEAHLSPRFVNTNSFAYDGLTSYNGELAGRFGPWWFASQYITSEVDSAVGGDPSFDSFYVQSGYFLTGESRAYKNSSGSWNRIKPNANWGMGGGGAWEIAGRYSNINLNDGNISGGEMDVFTLALNWYPNPATRLMINYVLSDVDGVGEADFILLRLQFDF